MIDLSASNLGGVSDSGVQTITVNNGYVKYAAGTATAPLTDISVHFQGDSNGGVAMAPTDTGLSNGGTGGPASVADTNWTNLPGAGPTTLSSLLNSAGTSSGASVSWAGNNSWATKSPDHLMDGYLDNTPGHGADTVTISNIPGVRYLHSHRLFRLGRRRPNWKRHAQRRDQPSGYDSVGGNNQTAFIQT